jgi:hypothetical protein
MLFLRICCGKEGGVKNDGGSSSLNFLGNL